MRALSVATVWLVCFLAGCGQSNVPPLKAQVNSDNGRLIIVFSESSARLKNVRVVGPGFDVIAAKTLEPKTYCQLQFGTADVPWEPRKGEAINVFCDGYTEPVEVIVESEYRGFIR